MQTVVIVIHLMLVAALIATVLLQKSEGGGLGMGGGAGFMSSRGTANLLSRTTAVLAVGFFLTSRGTRGGLFPHQPVSVLARRL
jgi:preprotein translocase subunit SecG